MTDIIIIGGGPSGMSAALYALRAGKSVLILEKENFGGQIANSPRVENYPSIKEISGIEFSNNLFEQILALGAKFELEEVERIEKNADIFVVKTNYDQHSAKSVIIANGVKHRHVGIAREEELAGKGISYCAVCDGAFYKNEDVILIGDANTALQYALLLSNYCRKVFVATLFDRFFADNILVERLKNKSNIEYRHNLSMKEFLGIDEITGAIFIDTKTREEIKYNAKAIFIAIGQIPDNDKYSNLVDLEKGYIVTNNKMETKTAGLFAIGDTRKKDVRQLVTATSDGAIGALSAIRYLN
ncbi:MAG: FAD-dependent oxidoreductase [Bacilli bacterium]|jgi:thioredoxin reductase (NADPH)